MKRIAAWLIGPLLLASIAVSAGPAAAGAHPAVRPKVIAGEYTLYGKYGTSNHYIPYSMTLRIDHTGTTHFGDEIIWSTDAKDITMTFNNGLWTYLGRKTRHGLNSLKNPGTLTNINGGTGTWYAIKNSD
jgi:hypothetical protein